MMTTVSLIKKECENIEYDMENNNDYNKQDGGADLTNKSSLKMMKLPENCKLRAQSLKKLRYLLQQNNDLVLTEKSLSENFLLRFLRAKKYDINQAEQAFLKYLNLRRTFPHITFNLDFEITGPNTLISNGYIFPSPVRDKFGRRVVIVQARYLNAKKHSSVDQAKAHAITYETLLEDPNNQISGIVHVGDFSGASLQELFTAVTNWQPTEFARLMKWGEQSMPITHKGIHIVNCPSTVKWIIDFVKSRISSKMKDRIFAYTNLKHLRNNFDEECLPLELGGKIPMHEMIELWKSELLKRRPELLQLDNIKILSDKRIIRHKNKNNSSLSDCKGKKKGNPSSTDNHSTSKSIFRNFRKLELD